MADQNWQEWFEQAWAFREDTIYPSLFGPSREGIFVLDGSLFTKVFQQDSFDPRWLFYGVFQFSPTPDRSSWLYVSSGLSNAWEADSPNTESLSGLGSEFLFESPTQSGWAITLLQRMIAFQILLAAGRFPGKGLLGIGDRIPLRSPLDGKNSKLTWLLLTETLNFSGLYQLPSGGFRFTEFVGITEDEAEYGRANGSNELSRTLLAHKALPVTDPGRKTILAA